MKHTIGSKIMEWISVKDRLPEVSQEVIVTDGICSVCAIPVQLPRNQ